MHRIAFVLSAFSLAAPALAGPLHDAAREGDLQKIEQLVAEGAVVDERGGGGTTPLLEAVLAGQIGAVNLLIVDGADIQAGNEGGFTPLHAAAFGGHNEIVELLLEKGVDVNVRSEYRVTPLHVATGAESPGHGGAADRQGRRPRCNRNLRLHASEPGYVQEP